MAKRTTDRPVEDGDQAYFKRQKIKHVTGSTEEIQSSRQLQQLLAFDQNIGRARHGNLGNAFH
jgi:nucleolar pre-ribosomal-associated protein 1